MNNQDSATKEARETGSSFTPSISDPDHTPPGKPATEEQLTKVEKQMTGFERATLRLAVLAFIISVVAAAFMCAQWWEMHTTGIDTHDLAIAAKAQADAAKKQAEQAEAQTNKMGESLTKTDKLIGTATRQAEATNDLAREAKRSANTAEQSLTLARKTLEAQERPWIVPFLMQLSNEPEEGKKFTIKVSLMNTGRTPAIDLVNQSNLYMWIGEPPPSKFILPEHPVSRGMLAPAAGSGFTNNGATFTTSEVELTQAQVTAYKDKQTKLYVHALVRYRGSSGGQYWLKVCGFHVAGDALTEFGYCEHGNEVGDGEPK